MNEIKPTAADLEIDLSDSLSSLETEQCVGRVPVSFVMKVLRRAIYAEAQLAAYREATTFDRCPLPMGDVKGGDAQCGEIIA